MVPRSYYGGAWSADSRHFFYTVHDDAYRPFQVWRHAIGTPTEDDVLVLEETTSGSTSTSAPPAVEGSS